MSVIAFKHFIHVDSCSDSNCSELVGWVLLYNRSWVYTRSGRKMNSCFPRFWRNCFTGILEWIFLFLRLRLVFKIDRFFKQNWFRLMVVILDNFGQRYGKHRSLVSGIACAAHFPCAQYWKFTQKCYGCFWASSSPSSNI